MHEMINQTPYKAELIPGLDKDGYDYAIIVIKGTFLIRDNQHQLILAEEQLPIIQKSEYYGESGKTSIKYETDVALRKHTTDIVLNGHAYAPQNKPVHYVDVALKVNDRVKSRRVIGNRFWTQSGNNWQISPPEPFERMSLLYENAYGGFDLQPNSEGVQTFNEHNPVGKGHIGEWKKQPDEGMPLPNIEDPSNMIQNWKDRPNPVGFGFISGHWQPRISLAGTYDENWEKDRLPLLPNDFDERYYNSAHPDFISTSNLMGGEMISVKNVTHSGDLTFSIPIMDSAVNIKMNGKNKAFIPKLDTVLIESDPQIVQLTWRATVPCAKKYLYIDSITITGGHI